MSSIVLRIPKKFMKRRLSEPRKRKAAYALPSLFTAGNIFLGFVSILKSIQGAVLVSSGFSGFNPHFETAAIAIGVAVFLDGLDGRIARMMKTVSDFGRELDSLADLITFGIAPAVLAFTWGIFGASGGAPFSADHLQRVGYFTSFLYLLCGAARLARFNIQVNPMPKNPGHPERKYFVGLPIPAAAALVAAVVYAADSAPLGSWVLSSAWMILLTVLAFLMVSTWRYRSFKDFKLLRPRSPLTVVLAGSLIYLIWHYSHPTLLAMAVSYVGSGIIVRIGGVFRRYFRRTPVVELGAK